MLLRALHLKHVPGESARHASALREVALCIDIHHISSQVMAQDGHKTAVIAGISVAKAPFDDVARQGIAKQLGQGARDDIGQHESILRSERRRRAGCEGASKQAPAQRTEGGVGAKDGKPGKAVAHPVRLGETISDI
ncbi:zinc protease [Bordetella pertussis]|nr:zinc protease [Bordetella pertussis]